MSMPFFLGLTLICLLLLFFCLMFTVIRTAGQTRAERMAETIHPPGCNTFAGWMLVGVPIFGTLMIVFGIAQIIAMML